MRWLIDEMLPPETAAELNGRGYDATSVAEVGLAGQADPVEDRAVADGRIVVTPKTWPTPARCSTSDCA